MSYRLGPPPEVREPMIPMFDTARNSYIEVDNGTISRINIPCFYARRFSRQDRMIWDHMGWPRPGSPDRSDYAQVLAIRDIDLETEGYTTVIVALGDNAVDGLAIYGSIEYDFIYLTISAICPDAEKQDAETEFAVYVSGNNNEAGSLRDLVTKGVIRVKAGYLGNASPSPGPSPEPEPGTHVISYTANGGTGYVEPQTVVDGNYVSLRSNAYVRSGYTFVEWNTSSSGAGVGYAEGQSIIPHSNMVLYAKWNSDQPGPGPGPDPEPSTGAWGNATWGEIIEMLRAHYAGSLNIHDYWNIGESRVVHLNAMQDLSGIMIPEQDVEFVLMSADNYVKSGTTDSKAAFIIGQKNPLSIAVPSGVNTTWLNSMRSRWCENTYLSALPDELRSLCQYVNLSVDGTIHMSRCFLPAESEVFGSTVYSTESERGLRQYEYYRDSSNISKNMTWLERSISNSSNTIMNCVVNTSGRPAVLAPNRYNVGIAPCVCI